MPGVANAAAPRSAVMPSALTTGQPSRGRIYLRALARDPFALAAAIFMVVLILAAIFAPWVAPYDPERGGLMLRNKPPLTPAVDGGIPYLLGTDPLGRDELTRLIYGARISLAVGFLSVLVSGTIGVTLGLTVRGGR